MKLPPRFILSVVILAAIAGAYWLYSNPGTEASIAPPQATGAKGAQATAALSPSAVLSIQVNRPSAMPAARAKASGVPTLAHEFDTARMLKPLYDRLTGPGAPSTAEAKFILYKILATCATPTDRAPDSAPRPSVAERRKTLADGILDSNPDKQKRLDAFDALASRCDGFANVTTSRAELDRLRAEAARDGDPGARASQIAHDVFELPMTPGTPAGTIPIGEAQIADLRQVLASRDPDAILAAGTILSNTFPNVVLEAGPNHDEIDGAASMAAWRLLACEYGMDCGPGNSALMSACAYRGQCGAGNIPDLVFYYQATPSQAQLIDQYRQAFQSAIEGGDWGQLQAEWRQHRPNAIYGFTTSP